MKRAVNFITVRGLQQEIDEEPVFFSGVAEETAL